MLSAASCTLPTLQPVFNLPHDHKFPVIIERGSHPFPFRTRQLSLSSPMILSGQLFGKVGRRRDKFFEKPLSNQRLFAFLPPHSHVAPPPLRAFSRNRSHAERRREPNARNGARFSALSSPADGLRPLSLLGPPHRSLL